MQQVYVAACRLLGSEENGVSVYVGLTREAVCHKVWTERCADYLGEESFDPYMKSLAEAQKWEEAVEFFFDFYEQTHAIEITCEDVAPPPGPGDVRCSHCGSDDVQHVMWVHMQSGEVLDEFGWNEETHTYCPRCSDVLNRGDQRLSDIEDRQSDRRDGWSSAKRDNLLPCDVRLRCRWFREGWNFFHMAKAYLLQSGRPLTIQSACIFPPTEETMAPEFETLWAEAQDLVNRELDEEVSAA